MQVEHENLVVELFRWSFTRLDFFLDSVDLFDLFINDLTDEDANLGRLDETSALWIKLFPQIIEHCQRFSSNLKSFFCS